VAADAPAVAAAELAPGHPAAGSLDRLVDIVEAEPVSLLWPLPPLAWLLLAVLAVTGGALLLRRLRRWRADRYRREALGELQALPGAGAEARNRLLALRSLLKRAALVAYGREAVAPLHGEAWWNFLDHCGADSAFSAGLGRHVDTLLLQPPGPVPVAPELVLAFEDAVRVWLRAHRRDLAPC
jgi:hypothetical protein